MGKPSFLGTVLASAIIAKAKIRLSELVSSFATNFTKESTLASKPLALRNSFIPIASPIQAGHSRPLADSLHARSLAF